MTRKLTQAAFGLLTMLAVTVTGCNHGNSPSDKAKEKQGESGKQNTEQQKSQEESSVHKDVRVEFSENLEMGGEIQISINEGMITVWYTTASKVVYLGSSKLSAQGNVSLDLHAVRDSAQKVPFEGVYDKANKRFQITKLTDKYLKQAILLNTRLKGLSDERGSTFVKYVTGVVEDESGKAVQEAVPFVITVDSGMVTVFAGYDDAKSGFRGASGVSALKGDEARVELMLGASRYEAIVVFTRSKGKSGTTYGVKSFEVRKHSEINHTSVVLSDSLITQKSGLQLRDENGKKLGTLDVYIRGSLVTMTLRQATAAENASFTPTDEMEAGVVQVKRVSLEPTGTGDGLYQSKYLEKAHKNFGTNKDHAIPHDKSVFVFVKSRGANPDDDKYNTYDLRIEKYDPKAKRFYIRGMYLTSAKATVHATNTDENAGQQLLTGLVPVQGKKPLHIFFGGAEQSKLEEPLHGYVVAGE